MTAVCPHLSFSPSKLWVVFSLCCFQRSLENFCIPPPEGVICAILSAWLFEVVALNSLFLAILPLTLSVSRSFDWPRLSAGSRGGFYFSFTLVPSLLRGVTSLGLAFLSACRAVRECLLAPFPYGEAPGGAAFFLLDSPSFCLVIISRMTVRHKGLQPGGVLFCWIFELCACSFSFFLAFRLTTEWRFCLCGLLVSRLMFIVLCGFRVPSPLSLMSYWSAAVEARDPFVPKFLEMS